MSSSACSLCSLWQSSIGKKLVVAITGLGMVLFLAGHLTGNLLSYSGPEAFNEYAKWLHELGHGKAVWIARIGLLAMIVLHVIGTVQLTIQNRARNADYIDQNSMRATKSSKLMIWSGLTTLLFIIFHLLQFTVRSTDDMLARLGDNGEAYAMVIEGFKHKGVSVFYIIAITCLCSHLHHGVASIFQTLGLRSRKTAGLIDKGSIAYAVLIWIGFVSIPVSICFFHLGSEHLSKFY